MAMPSSRIQTTTIGVSTVVTIRDSLTYQTCEELKKIFNQIVNRRRNKVVLDFRSVPFLDSQALELLLEIHETLVNSGGTLKIFGLNGVCRDILICSRLINLFHVYTDMQEALRSEP